MVCSCKVNGFRQIKKINPDLLPILLKYGYRTLNQCNVNKPWDDYLLGRGHLGLLIVTYDIRTIQRLLKLNNATNSCKSVAPGLKKISDGRPVSYSASHSKKLQFTAHKQFALDLDWIFSITNTLCTNVHIYDINIRQLKCQPSCVKVFDV